MSEISTKIEVPLATRILVIDDSRIMLDQMLKILSTLGFTDIVSAKDGASAWNLILNHINLEKPFEMILCDWNMPGHLSGIQLLEKVRNTSLISSTVFMLVTTENTFDKVKKAIDLGVSNYIVKPYSPTDVAEKLRTSWKKRKLPPA